MSDRIDIGHGVTLRCFEQDCVIHAVDVAHTSTFNGAPCSTGVSLACEPEWPDGLTMVQKSPLTIAEVIACEACDLRGRIDEGKWVPA